MEWLMLKLKVQYFGHLLQSANSLEGLDADSLDAGKDWKWKEKRAEEDEMVGWHHRHNAHESEQTLGDSDDREVWCIIATSSDTTEWLNTNNQEEDFIWMEISISHEGI